MTRIEDLVIQRPPVNKLQVEVPEAHPQHNEALGPISMQNTYMLGSGRGTAAGGGDGGRVSKAPAPPSPFQLQTGNNIDLGVTENDDVKEAFEEHLKDLRLVHAPLGQHLERPARPMSAGPGSIASRTFETPDALRRYLGSSSIRPSNNSRGAQGFGLGIDDGGVTKMGDKANKAKAKGGKKERPKTAR